MLAKVLGLRFIDTDLVIQEREGRTLQQIIQQEGAERFYRIEEDAIRSLDTVRTVIATGGSAVYGEKAMAHLRSAGILIYLKLTLESVQSRLGDLNERGVPLRRGQTLADLYLERIPMYERHADLTVDCEQMELRETVLAIKKRLAQWRCSASSL